MLVYRSNILPRDLSECCGILFTSDLIKFDKNIRLLSCCFALLSVSPESLER